MRFLRWFCKNNYECEKYRDPWYWIWAFIMWGGVWGLFGLLARIFGVD